MEIWVEQEFAKREANLIRRAKQMKAEGRDDVQIALAMFRVSDGVALSRVRDLLRGEG